MEIKGFFDLHTHGIGRYDTKTGNPEVILKIAELHAKAGTSAILPTIYSGTIKQMRVNMEAVRQAIEIQRSEDRKLRRWDDKKLLTSQLPKFSSSKVQSSSLLPPPSSLILGVHLEGPFLNPIRCGAQDKDSFIKPTISNLKKLIEGYENIIKIITIAPELPGALKVIEKCVSLGIKVNMGHSDATYREALNGKKAGATGITHIFNTMRPFHHREIGLVGLGLLDEDIYVEVITDKIHLSNEVLKLIFKLKRPDRIILVSDSVKGRGNKKSPIYSKAGVLAGSSITLSDPVKNLIKIGIPEKVVLKAAVDNPKRYLKFKNRKSSYFDIE
jgi:N-acetylglucosamine-6-phosphate deacetylase